MRHFAHVLLHKRSACISLIRETLSNNSAGRKIRYDGVYWRNIGLYHDSSSQERVVVFDMGSVVSDESGDTSWIDRACGEPSWSRKKE